MFNGGPPSVDITPEYCISTVIWVSVPQLVIVISLALTSIYTAVNTSDWIREATSMELDAFLSL